MNILYVARHNQRPSNDDEGSIADALHKLGNKVTKIHESTRWEAVKHTALHNVDFALFHHPNPYNEILGQLAAFGVPRVFWCFDLIDYPLDTTLMERNLRRSTWAREICKKMSLGFMTDGDWVDTECTISGRSACHLVHLTQGADHRIIGIRNRTAPPEDVTDVFMSGTIKGGGKLRNEFVEVTQAYFPTFVRVDKCFRQSLAEKIANVNITVAPLHPATNNYWSNRVYISSGFGACLVHPYCNELAKQYTPGEEIIMYKDMNEYLIKIREYLTRPKEMLEIGHNAYQRTAKEHTYVHRCDTLLQHVENYLG